MITSSPTSNESPYAKHKVGLLRDRFENFISKEKSSTNRSKNDNTLNEHRNS